MRVLLLLALSLSPTARPGEVVETFDDGTVRARYSVDDLGRRHGTSVEYWPSGKLRVKSRYDRDLLSGRYESWFEGGEREVRASYKRGELSGRYELGWPDGTPRVEGRYKDGAKDGEFEYFREEELVSRQEWDDGVLALLDGIVPHPRTLEEITATLEDIEGGQIPVVLETRAEGAIPPALAAGRALGLRRLQAYRYLSCVPWEDLVLDETYNYHCSAAVRLLAALGQLDHTPENPGLPEEEYRDGYEGTKSSNISMGRGDLRAVVDGFMDDSDPSNIDRVGHRRWCLNPAMRRTGFGKQGAFAAMWALDTSRGKIPDWETIAYPAPGWYPSSRFGDRHAWSVRFSGAHFGKLERSEIEVSVVPIDADYLPAGDPLSLDYLGVSNGQVIFRPAEVDTSPGHRYRVEITGIDGRKDVDRLEYVVEFFGDVEEAEGG